MSTNEDLIPSGPYCYRGCCGDICMCPFWSKSSVREMAKCSLLGASDVLLDEFIKICGVKTELEKDKTP